MAKNSKIARIDSAWAWALLELREHAGGQLLWVPMLWHIESTRKKVIKIAMAEYSQLQDAPLSWPQIKRKYNLRVERVEIKPVWLGREIEL